MTLQLTMRPENFVAEINRHHLYRAADGEHVHLWTPGIGWWGFDLTEVNARRTAEAVSGGCWGVDEGERSLRVRVVKRQPIGEESRDVR